MVATNIIVIIKKKYMTKLQQLHSFLFKIAFANLKSQIISAWDRIAENTQPNRKAVLIPHFPPDRMGYWY